MEKKYSFDELREIVEFYKDLSWLRNYLDDAQINITEFPDKFDLNYSMEQIYEVYKKLQKYPNEFKESISSLGTIIKKLEESFTNVLADSSIHFSLSEPPKNNEEIDDGKDIPF